MRKVISAMEAVEMIRGKAASGFVPDFSDGAFLSPTLTKITDSDALKLYRNNEWVHAVVNRIVDDCVKVTPRVVLKDQTKRATVKQQNKIDEVKMFLDDPNENKESFREIREKFIRDMEIYGRGALTHEEKIEMDVCYVDNRSMKMDLKIICQTFFSIFGKKINIYEEQYSKVKRCETDCGVSGFEQTTQPAGRSEESRKNS